MKVKEVTLFGATGLIGGFLLDVLIADNDINKIKVITRKPFSVINKKIENKIIDFSNINSFSKTVENSDVVFASIGTTQSKVNGNKKEYKKIDYDILNNIAKACKENNVKNFSFVSSSGANIKSNNFYLQLKGEIESSILNLNLFSTSIFRPSLLLGKRKELRFGERIAQLIMPFFSFFMPSTYRPIKASLVAKSMVNISKLITPGFKIYHYKEIIKQSE
ncbi:MAG: segregation protein B [Flavobacteriaceae bacterium]|nr:segregation protein B [Flavobacteriaceae bacterium]|tara:strand:- start:708 stop:1367 length:660 start_codon:yes stop_codon:yes gene_type:complete